MENINVSVTHTDVEVVTVAMAGPQGPPGKGGSGGGDSNWTALQFSEEIPGAESMLFVRRVGNIVYAQGQLAGNSGDWVPGTELPAVIPEGFSPESYKYVPVLVVPDSMEFLMGSVIVIPASEESVSYIHAETAVEHGQVHIFIDTWWFTNDAFPPPQA